MAIAELEELLESGEDSAEIDALRQAWWEHSPPSKSLPQQWNVGAGGSSLSNGEHYLPSHDVEEDVQELPDGPPADGSIPADAPVLPAGVTVG